MGANSFSSVEIDAIGEILNISLGASATAVSTMLDARVDITTPIVRVLSKEEFEFTSLEPAVGVEINYVEGLTGSNLMLLKRQDVRIIVGMLMGMDIPEEEFELDEMNISAICEVMNQMMGASATALSELLDRSVNISTPKSFEIISTEHFKDKYFEEGLPMVVIRFTLSIADKLESEFMNLMPIELAKELVSGFFPEGSLPEADEAPIQEAAPQPVQSMAAQPQMPVQPQPLVPSMDAQPMAVQPMAVQPTAVQPTEIPQPMPQMPVQQQMPTQPMTTEMQQQMMAQPQQPAMGAAPGMNYGMQQMPVMQGYPMQMSYQESQAMEEIRKMQQQLLDQMKELESLRNAPKQIKVHPAIQPNIREEGNAPVNGETNLDLIMGVPVEVSVEIGRVRKLVKDVLELNKGSLVVLDKLAGEQVDLYVNGQCIAKGDVVVVDDNFGIRITEILESDITVA